MGTAAVRLNHSSFFLWTCCYLRYFFFSVPKGIFANICKPADRLFGSGCTAYTWVSYLPDILRVQLLVGYPPPAPILFFLSFFSFCPSGHIGQPLQAADRGAEALERLHPLFPPVRPELSTPPHAHQRGGGGGGGDGSGTGQ